jgi:hypothetical protein
MDKIPINIANFIQWLNRLKSALENAFFKLNKTFTSGAIMATMQYMIGIHHPNGMAYN